MAYERFNADNAAMRLIDHQVGTIDWMHSAPKVLPVLGEIYADLDG